MGYFQIIRVDGSSKRYSSMIQMLQNIDREDLETLWKLVKAKHGLTRPEDGYDRNLHIFMLVEKRYPLTTATITEMLNKKLQADHWNEMCYQLLKLMTKHLKNPGKMNTIVLLLHLIRRREEEGINHLKQDQDIWGGPVFIGDKKSRYSAGGPGEICGGKEEDVGLDEFGEGGKGVISKIGEFGGDLGSELFGDRGEFKNRVMSDFCKKKGIKGEFSVARTPQQNGVAERRNKTLIEVARTITRKVEESLHIRFLKDKPIIAGDGPKWLFDIDVLTKSMNYVPVVAGTHSNDFAGTKESISAGHSRKETGSSQDYILMPLWKDGSLFDSSSKNASNDESQPSSDAGKKDDEGVNKESGIDDQEKPKNSIQDVNSAGPSTNTASTDVVGSRLTLHNI
ncbi:putative ribonuclease H-like domain-containing protein [Tanacetum coccineum]|uniref:Ribonuclease H-like domain-containing protein n=1 Tax=Tanacetum coccineum TaxID=301880 RepID=A0ABQ5BU75_9ASTR